jgi:hypothetical protein
MRPVCLFVLIGLVVAAMGIPMALRKVPRNRFYGLRIAATFADESVWYDANAVSGRDLIIAGLLVVMTALALWGLRLPADLQLGGSAAVLAFTLGAATVRGWRLARRLLRERHPPGLGPR